MWRELTAQITRFSGVSGTVTIPRGAAVTQIHAHGGTGGGTVQIFDDADPVEVPEGAGWGYQPEHLLVTPSAGGAQTIVFADTDAYFVECYNRTPPP